MADDSSDKTEAPTPKRREQAREDGQVARSTDLTASLLLLGITILLAAIGGQIVDALRGLVANTLEGSLAIRGQEDVLPVLTQVGLRVGGAMWPMLAGTLVIAVVANLIQVGFHPSAKGITPKFPFNPVDGVKKLFSGGGSGRGPVGLAMNVAKLAVVTFLVWTALNGKMGAIVGVANLEPGQIYQLCVGIIYDITIRIGVLLLVLAVADFGFQKYQIEKRLRMSKQEIKDEMKNSEGDPKIKARRRQIAQQLAMKRMATEVPKADVIVTNPTHYAIALKYDQANGNAPVVVAKGMDLVALRIREIAGEHGIPIIERPPLARALYRLCDVGQEIPEQFYNAVAEILAYVYELTGKSRRRAG